MIPTITEKGRAMMIDFQALIQVWGEAVNTAVELHQRSPNEDKAMTVMAIKHHTKHHTRCCMDLANRRTMLTATKYVINPHSTIYVDLDAMPVDSFPKINAARACSAQGRSPA